MSVLYWYYNIRIVATGWYYYVPENIRQQAPAFIVGALQHNIGISKLVKDMVVHENPKEKRDALIQTLKKNLNEIHAQITNAEEKNLLSAQGTAGHGKKGIVVGPEALPMKQIITSSERTLEELEKTNSDQSSAELITSQVVEILLPSSTGNQCARKP